MKRHRSYRTTGTTRRRTWMTEAWKEIPGYPLYEVSDQGRVRSWNNNGGNRTGRRKRPKMLKTPLGKRGYPLVGLWSKGVGKLFAVHRLVLLTFVGPCPAGLECCHSDGERSNNCLKNLRYDTHPANFQDAIGHGTIARGEARYNAKLTDVQVRFIRKLYVAGQYSQERLACLFCVSRRAIGKVCSRETWAHIT